MKKIEANIDNVKLAESRIGYLRSFVENDILENEQLLLKLEYNFDMGFSPSKMSIDFMKDQIERKKEILDSLKY